MNRCSVLHRLFSNTTKQLRKKHGVRTPEAATQRYIKVVREHEHLPQEAGGIVRTEQSRRGGRETALSLIQDYG